MSLKDTLRKAAGLFIEIPPSENPTEEETGSPRVAPRTVEQIVTDSAGPNLDEIKVEAQPNLQVLSPDGKVDFDAIYKMAGLPESAFGAEQVLELVAQLPADLPMESKRGTLRVMIGPLSKAVGASTESILADTSRKLAALSAYSDSFAKMAGEFSAKSELEIERLQAEIERHKANIADAVAKQSKVTAACEAEGERLDDVLEYFTQDVPPSKHA